MYKAIIIDDEPDAIDSLEFKIKKFCHNVGIVGSAKNVTEGLREIRDKKPDIVFLDIEMPNENGFDLLDKIKERNFEVIFVTAYNNYAIKAFKYSAIDYLLKPVDIKELIAAVERIEKVRVKGVDSNRRYNILLENLKTDSPSKLAVPQIGHTEYLDQNDILKIDAERCYSIITLLNKQQLTVSQNLSSLTNSLSDNKIFMRIHKSHIVNLNHVKSMKLKKYGGVVEMVDGTQIELSHRKRKEFSDTMKKFTKKMLN